MVKFRLYFTCLVASLWLPAHAQGPDTLILTYTDFIRAVNENHPVSRQADLFIQAGYAGELAARGGFDPRLYYSIEQKHFDNKHYWTLQDGGIKIPTPFALEISTGIEQSNGAFLNNESITSGSGLIYTQFSLPLLQGLLVDERRNALKQAKLYRDLSYLEQQLLLNELFAKAAKAYWEWAQAYYKTEIQREAVLLAQQRLEAVKQAAFLGDHAAIDTLEAGIQYQERNVTLQQQEMEFYSKTLLLSVYLWNESSEPLQLTAATLPPKSEELPGAVMSDSILKKIDSLVSWHPTLLAYENKTRQLGLDLRLKQDKLKPVFNVKFNPLYEIGNYNASLFYGVNSYKWGAEFQFPVFLRKERGEIERAKIRLADLHLERQNKKALVTNGILASYNEFTNTAKQAAQYATIVEHYYRLLQAEKKLFEIGESSVFMVNNRELSYINAKIKLNDLQLKTRIAGVELLYNSGQLFRLP